MAIRYELQYSDREWEIETRKERGQPLPDWYINKPELPDYLRWFLMAFWELSTCRAWDEGLPRPISWTVVREYAEYHDFDLDYLFSIIHGMDAVFIEIHRNEYDRKMRESSNKSKSLKKK